MIIPLSAMAVNWWRIQRDNLRAKVLAGDYDGAITDIDELNSKLDVYVANLPVDASDRNGWIKTRDILSHVRAHILAAAQRQPESEGAQQDKVNRSVDDSTLAGVI